MGTFEERERAYESRWAHDEELHFKVMARSNKLLGLWAAAEMGLSGARADEYAKSLVQAGLSGMSKDPVFEKVHADFAAAKVTTSDHLIHRKMEELHTVAGEEIAVRNSRPGR